MQEIRFHGRGGQGVVIGSEVLAQAFFKEGKFVQAFPFFGVERRGAPVTAFCRIDECTIHLRNQIYNPDYVVVLDASLVEGAGIVAGLKQNGTVLINTNRSSVHYQQVLSNGFKVFTVDASTIAAGHCLGSKSNPIVNTAICGAFAGASGLVSIEAVEAAIAMDCNVKGIDFDNIRQRISIGQGSALSFSTYMGWKNPNSNCRDAHSVVDAVDLVFDYFRKTPPVSRPPLDAKTRKENFTPIQTTFSQKQAERESERCMHCGRCTECDNCLVFCPDMSVRIRGNGDFGYTIEYDYCKGCGICAAECPRHAITMISEETPVAWKEG